MHSTIHRSIPLFIDTSKAPLFRASPNLNSFACSYTTLVPVTASKKLKCVRVSIMPNTPYTVNTFTINWSILLNFSKSVTPIKITYTGAISRATAIILFDRLLSEKWIKISKSEINIYARQNFGMLLTNFCDARNCPAKQSKSIRLAPNVIPKMLPRAGINMEKSINLHINILVFNFTDAFPNLIEISTTVLHRNFHILLYFL